MVKVKHVSKSFGDQTVLQDFSLTLPDTGIICLFGPSGCGKTTLIRIISGLESADEGRVEREGEVSIVFQEDRLLPWLTARENLMIIHDQMSREQAGELLDRVGLTEAADQLPSQLSGGMKRRVAIARALGVSAPLYILDEPLKGLDDTVKQSVLKELEAVGKRALVLLITHEKEEAVALSDVIYLLGSKPMHLVKEVVLDRESFERDRAKFESALEEIKPM